MLNSYAKIAVQVYTQNMLDFVSARWQADVTKQIGANSSSTHLKYQLVHNSMIFWGSFPWIRHLEQVYVIAGWNRTDAIQQQ